MIVRDPYGTPDGTFARRGRVAHTLVGSSWGVTFGMFGFDLRFALVAFHFVSIRFGAGAWASMWAREKEADGPVETI